MQLPEKLGTFPRFFIAFLESSSNFQQLEKKDEPHGPNVPEGIHSERRIYLHI